MYQPVRLAGRIVPVMKVPKLPQGFELEAFLDGDAVMLERRMVACSATLDDGRSRLTVKVGARDTRTVFVSSPETARTYMVRWSFKWEREIRELYAGLRLNAGWEPGEALNRDRNPG